MNMDTDYWRERWSRNETGFHQKEINPHLQRFWSALNLAPGSRVFVPLCGKSRDMLWLRAQGYEVVGVEISPLAVEAFFAESGLFASVTKRGTFSIYQTEGIRLYCGDFFQLTSEDLVGVSAVFDRASLIAFPPSMRSAYAAHMQTILASGVNTLLVTFDYPQHEMQGPPFSVKEPEVRALYEKTGEVSVLHSADILDKEPRFRDKGITQLQEKIFLVTQNPR
ncbi:MAG: thiopurine S-methyltransferase [Candidatus Nitrotoga sp. SPKER]|nr:MAG: thiopurine S-methyltransferase [Candidatus Nitrotoga sp. SPKER]